MIGRYLPLFALLAVGSFMSLGCTSCHYGIGCGSSCGDRCGYGGQVYQGCGEGCCESGLKLCPCTGPECSDCGPTCAAEPGCCAVEAGCGCEPECDACEPGCGVDSGCCGTCGSRGCAPRLLGGIGCFFQSIFGEVGGGCNGCDGELYWSEWHNDPPRCCDPCDRCGDWVGPGSGGCTSGCEGCGNQGYIAKGHSTEQYSSAGQYSTEQYSSGHQAYNSVSGHPSNRL